MSVKPEDEYMHENNGEANFNESMYINCFDPDSLVGGWFRIGNRANEGYAEMTVCLYLPDGRVAFMFGWAVSPENDESAASTISTPASAALISA